MNVEEIRKKVRSLCEDAGLQFFFAVPNASEWTVTDCEHLRKIVSYHKELETLPLVTPTRKKGKWIFSKTIFDKHGCTVECSSCHKKWKTYDEIRWRKENKFCPNCGAEMENEEC